MSKDELRELKNGLRKFMGEWPGVTGIGAREDYLIVYVENNEVPVPCTYNGMPVVKRITGMIEAHSE